MGTFRGSVQRLQHAVHHAGAKVMCRRRWHMRQITFHHTNRCTMASFRSSISVAYAHRYTDDVLQTREVFVAVVAIIFFLWTTDLLWMTADRAFVYVACIPLTTRCEMHWRQSPPMELIRSTQTVVGRDGAPCLVQWFEERTTKSHGEAITHGKRLTTRICTCAGHETPISPSSCGYRCARLALLTRSEKGSQL